MLLGDVILILFSKTSREKSLDFIFFIKFDKLYRSLDDEKI